MITFVNSEIQFVLYYIYRDGLNWNNLQNNVFNRKTLKSLVVPYQVFTLLFVHF